ncbi:MAG TPA: hypothetical protein VLI67_07030, partial [Vicinamibacteria bacterium]|nr:hypothetical protein [Vicinamibacteria bacterium]
MLDKRRNASPGGPRRAVLAPILAALLPLCVPAGAQTPAEDAAGDPESPPAPAPADLSSASTGAPSAVTPPFSLGPSFDADLLRDLPRAHGLWSPFETAEPTAIVDRLENGGMYVGEPGLLGIRGSSWTQASWRLGDFDITDPDRIGTPLLLVDPEALEAIETAALLMPAEEGGMGPAIRLVLRRPRDAWHRVIHADLVPPGLQQDSRASGAPAIARYAAFGSSRFRVDGPLVKDRLGLLVTGSFARSR